MDVAIMVEGQSGLNWPRWQRLVRAVEDLGFAALYRSDHLVSAQPPDQDALELWTSLTWLAASTRRIEFGQLVSPLTFRHPVHLAHAAAALDDLSGGRFTLGLGAGWSQREHEMYGFPMYPPTERLDRFEEGLRIVSGLLRSAEPLTQTGRHFTVHEAVLLPRPKRAVPILVAGRGRKRSLPLAAQYADAWNAMFLAPDALAEMNAELNTWLAEFGRQPADLQRTVMQAVDIGRTAEDAEAKHAANAWAFWREPGLLVGTPRVIGQQLLAFQKAGANRVIVQWLDLDDLTGLELLAEAAAQAVQQVA